MIRAAGIDDAAAWLALRARLWPLTPEHEHRAAFARRLADASRFVALLAIDDAGRAVGFAETECVVFHREEIK